MIFWWKTTSFSITPELVTIVVFVLSSCFRHELHRKRPGTAQEPRSKGGHTWKPFYFNWFYGLLHVTAHYVHFNLVHDFLRTWGDESSEYLPRQQRCSKVSQEQPAQTWKQISPGYLTTVWTRETFAPSSQLLFAEGWWGACWDFVSVQRQTHQSLYLWQRQPSEISMI